MYRAPIICNEAEVLLKLVRLALGTEPRMYFGEPVKPFPKNINWDEVIRLSYLHKVSAIAVDGLKSSGYNLYADLSESETIVLKDKIDKWYQDVNNCEHEYDYFRNVVNVLCQIFHSQGLKTIILKGMGMAKYYPIPSHRGAGDIDIFLVDENNAPALERGIKIVKETLNIDIDLRCHHYEFVFRGVNVELHDHLTNIISCTSEEEVFRNQLRDLIYTDIKQSGCYYVPSATFNVVFLIRHMYAHFFWHGLKLRQFIDYYLFLKEHYSEVDWNVISRLLGGVSNYEFHKAVNAFLATSISNNEFFMTQVDAKSKYTDAIMHDVFVDKRFSEHIITELSSYYCSKDIIELLSGENWIYPTLRRIRTHFFHNHQCPFFPNRYF